jgi:hypothetical protein
MTRKLWVLATVTLFGVSALLAGVGLTRNATACDDAAKTAAATSSCCAKDGAKTASVDAKKVHNSMIKSAVVAPGAAPILNIAAFGGLLTAGTSGDCDWCPGGMSKEECEAAMAAGCSAMKGAATTASYEGHGATAVPAGHPSCSKSATTTAAVSSEKSCAQSVSMVTVAAGGEGCNKSANASAGHAGCDKSAAAAAGCCGGKSASAAGAKGECSTAKTASLKGVVDEMPYRENKRVVLAGSYACGHCSLEKTAECSPMLKTADGKVYPLLRNTHATAMRAAEGKNLEVSGTVKKVDGVKFLDVKSYKVI